MKEGEKKAERVILAITDFSKSSTNAILFAANLFRYSNLKFILLNVFDTPDDEEPLLISIVDILGKNSETALKMQSAEVADHLKNEKINISTYSATGQLKRAIGNIAREEEIDLIVAGIPAGKCPPGYLNTPVLFKGQSRYAVFLVPESCSAKPLRAVLTLNFDASRQDAMLKKDFEHIVNHDHVSQYTIHINEKKIDKNVTGSLHAMLAKHEVELIIFVPAPGDKIDRAMLDYQISELYPAVSDMLNC